MRQKQVERRGWSCPNCQTETPQVGSGLPAWFWNIRTDRSVIGALFPSQMRAGSHGAHVADAREPGDVLLPATPSMAALAATQNYLLGLLDTGKRSLVPLSAHMLAGGVDLPSGAGHRLAAPGRLRRCWRRGGHMGKVTTYCIQITLCYHLLFANCINVGNNIMMLHTI